MRIRFVVSGEGLRYRWFKDDVLLPDENGPEMVLSPAVAGDAGAYRLEASNIVGTTSATTVLVPPAPPLITQQPEVRAVLAGTSVTLSVMADSSPGPSYQWYRSGVPLSGASSANYLIDSMDEEDVGLYYVIVSNPYGSVTSASARISLATAPLIMSPVSAQSTTAGLPISFPISVVGTPPLTFHLYRGSTLVHELISATTGSVTATLGDPQKTDEGLYRWVISNAVGQTVSPDFTLSVGDSPPFIFDDLDDIATKEGLVMIFEIGVRGTAPLTYSWWVDGQAYENPSAPRPTTQLSLGAASPQDLGKEVRVVVSNAHGTVMSRTARVTSVTPKNPPPNDSIASALIINTLPFSQAGNNTDATRESGEPGHIWGGGASSSTWFKWIPATDGIALIDTEGSEIDTVLVVYEYDDLGGLAQGFNALFNRGGNKDQDGQWDPSARVVLRVVAGKTYYIAVGGDQQSPTSSSPARGSYNLNVRLGDAPQIRQLQLGSTNRLVPYEKRVEALGDSVTFSASGLPPGMTIDPSSGLITGAAQQAGSFAVLLSVSNSHGSGELLRRLFVGKSPATVLLGSLSAPHNGSPRSVSVTTEPKDLPVVVLYDGSQSPPTDAGTYSVQAFVNSSDYAGEAMGTLTITSPFGPLTFTGPDQWAATYGIEMSPYQILATGQPTEFAAENLPPGLSLDSATGIISGTPSAAGDYSPRITVRNGAGSSSTRIRLTVLPLAFDILLTDLQHAYSATPKPATATASRAGVDLAISYDGNPQPPTAAGYYLVSAVSNNINFAGSARAVLTVAKSPLTLRATDRRRFVGEANPALTYNVEGLVGPDTAGTALTGQPALSTTATVASVAGVYPITITAGTVNSANYAPSFAPGELELTLWTFAEWQGRNFAPLAASAAADADPDGDGLANLLEYAFDRDPLAPDAAVTANTVAGDRLTLGYPLRRDVSDLRYVPEVSADLADWQSGATVIEPQSVDALDAWLDWVTVSDSTQLSPTVGRRFLRVRVEVATP